MNYEIVNVNNIEFQIYETKTNQVIRTFTKFVEARDFIRNLNLGGGFDGSTPNFFLK